MKRSPKEVFNGDVNKPSSRPVTRFSQGGKWQKKCQCCEGSGMMWSVNWKKFIPCYLCHPEDQP